MGNWNQPVSIAAAGLNADITSLSLGLPPGLYKVKIIDGDVVANKSDPSKAPNLALQIEVIQGFGEGAAAAGAKDTINVTTDQKEDFSKRLQKALALSVGYPEAEVEQPQFVLNPQRVIGAEAMVFAQQNGVSDKGYPQVNRNFIPRALVPKKQAEITANGGKVPYGILGKDGRKDGGVGAAAAHPAMPAGAAPQFGGAPAGFAPPPVAGFGQPAAAAPVGFAPPANGAFAAPDLTAMSAGAAPLKA